MRTGRLSQVQLSRTKAYRAEGQDDARQARVGRGQLALRETLASIFGPEGGPSRRLSATEVRTFLAHAAKSTPKQREALREVFAEGMRRGFVEGHRLLLSGRALDLVADFTGVEPSIYLSTQQSSAPPTSTRASAMQAASPGLAAEASAASPAPAPATFDSSPLGTRLRAALGDDGAPDPSALVAFFAEQLGLDLSAAMEQVTAKQLGRGKVELRVLLRDAMDYRIQLGDGKTLKLQVPRSPTGTVAVIEAKFKADRGGFRLGGAGLRFEASGRAGSTTQLANEQLPRILNPGDLSGGGGAWSTRMKNVVADVVIRELSIDDEGAMGLDADVSILGGLMRRPLAEELGELPKIDAELRADDLVGLRQRERTPSTTKTTSTTTNTTTTRAVPRLSARELFASFATVAQSAEWKLELEADERLVGFGGQVVAKNAESLTGAVEATWRNAQGQAGRARLTVENDGETCRGQATLQLQMNGKDAAAPSPSAGRQALRQLVTWDDSGLQIGGMHIDTLLPLKLAPQQGAQAPKLGSPAFRRRIAALLDEDAPVTHGNEVRYLSSGSEALAARLDLIGRARPGQTLVMQTFIFKDDHSGGAMIDALIAAKDRGVDVRVLIDAVGSAELQDGELRFGGAAYERLRRSGVDVRLIHDPARSVRAGLQTLLTLAHEASLDDETRARLGKVHGLLEQLGPKFGTTLIQDPASIVDSLPEIMELLAELQQLSTQQALPERLQEAFATSFDGRSLGEMARLLLGDLSRDHRKRLVLFGESADGELAAETIMGGNNTADDYLLSSDDPALGVRAGADHLLWADADVHIRGAELVAREVDDFARTWSEAGPDGDTEDPPLVFDPRQAAGSGDGLALRMVHHRPIGAASVDDADNHFVNVLLATLEGLGAGDKLSIEMPYFVPSTAVMTEMIAAAKRGARLRVLTNGAGGKNDAKVVARHSRAFCLPRLVATPGIEVFERTDDADPVHQKSVIATNRKGEVLYLLGSQNLDDLSTRINQEMFIVGGTALHDSGADEVIERGLFRDFVRDTAPKVARRVTSEELRSESLSQTAMDYVRSLLAPIL